MSKSERVGEKERERKEGYDDDDDDDDDDDVDDNEEWVGFSRIITNNIAQKNHF